MAHPMSQTGFLGFGWLARCSLAVGEPLCHEMRGIGGQAGACSNRHRPAWSSARDSALRKGRAMRETDGIGSLERC